MSCLRPTEPLEQLFWDTRRLQDDAQLLLGTAAFGDIEKQDMHRLLDTLDFLRDILPADMDSQFLMEPRNTASELATALVEGLFADPSVSVQMSFEFTTTVCPIS